MVTFTIGEAMRINKSEINKLKPTNADEFHWDDNLKGFGLKLYRTGRISFILQGRLDGRSRRYTIGAFGSPWTADTARKQALKYLAQLAAGIDPTADQRARRLEGNLAKLADSYLLDGNLRKKPSTRSIEERSVRRHIIPLLGNKRISEITKRDLQKFLNDVAAGKTAIDEKTSKRGRAIVKGGRAVANRSLAVISALFNYAIECGLCSDNPTRGIKQYQLKVHDRFLNGEELQSLGDALNHAEKNNVSPYAVAAIRFILLTGCRSGEALNLQWQWIDYEHGLAKLPDSKTGQKILALGASALEMLTSLERVEDSPLVFVSSVGGTTPISIQKVWRNIREEAGLGRLRIHDLRHNFASLAVSSGHSLYMVAKLLGHTQSQTTQRYAHLAPHPVKQAADDISNHLASVVQKIDRKGG